MAIVWLLGFRLLRLSSALRPLRKLCLCLSLSHREVVIFDTVSETCPLLLIATCVLREHFSGACDHRLLHWLVILGEIRRILKVDSGAELGRVDELVDENLQLVAILRAVNDRVGLVCLLSSGAWRSGVIVRLNDRRVTLSYFFLERVDLHFSQSALHAGRDEGVVLQFFHGDPVGLIGL